MHDALKALAMIAVAMIVSTPVSARHQKKDFNRTVEITKQFNTDLSARKRVRHVKRYKRNHRRVAHYDRGSVIGGRPSGCPHRFCGCALSLKLFGTIRPALNLAANWKGFPQVSPAPGMVAARFGHVFQLVSHSGGNIWRVWDANSGGGRIRIHDRSIAGYTIHNPHGDLAAFRGRKVRYAKRHRHHRRYAAAV